MLCIKVINANLQLAIAYNEDQVLQFLLFALLDEYAVIVATLNAQLNLTVKDRLAILQNCKDILQSIKAAKAVALATKAKSAVLKQEECQFCQKGPYNTKKCKFKKVFNKILRSFTQNQIY